MPQEIIFTAHNFLSLIYPKFWEEYKESTVPKFSLSSEGHLGLLVVFVGGFLIYFFLQCGGNHGILLARKMLMVIASEGPRFDSSEPALSFMAAFNWAMGPGSTRMPSRWGLRTNCIGCSVFPRFTIPLEKKNLSVFILWQSWLGCGIVRFKGRGENLIRPTSSASPLRVISVFRDKPRPQPLELHCYRPSMLRASNLCVMPNADRQGCRSYPKWPNAPTSLRTLPLLGSFCRPGLGLPWYSGV